MISRKNKKNGFTLIEGLISVVIFMIIFTSIVSIFGAVLGGIKNNKATVNANSIALEQLEIIRGMNFDNVKTDTGWVPPGLIESEKILSRAGTQFTIRTDIAFLDDQFDGLGVEDTFPYDYKKVRVRVSWISPMDSSEKIISMSTNVVPIGLEGLSPDKGGILVSVFNASGEAVPMSSVHIESSSLGFLLDGLTDLNGNIWVPDLDPADDYHISATKTGYSIDQTYSVNTDVGSPAYNPTPVKPDVNVIVGEISNLGFAIDVLGSLNIRTVNYNNPQNWRVDSDLADNAQTRVSMDIDKDNNIFLSWLDDRSGTDRIYAQKYTYNPTSGVYEKQWADDVQITTANNKENPQVAVFTTNFFYIAWNDARDGNKDSYLQKFNSSDGSSVWNDVKVNVDSNNADQTDVDLAVDSAGNVYVAWVDDRDINLNIYAQKYDADGDNVWIEDLKINDATSGFNQENPQIIVDDDDNFYVLWEDESNINKDILLKKFDNNGNVLFIAKKINSDLTGFDQYDPSITFDGSEYFYIAWSDERNSQPDIYAQKIDKLGNTVSVGQWSISDVKINDDTSPDAWRTSSVVAYYDDSSIYYSWEDDRNGDSDIFSTKFNSDGEKVWAYDLIMNGDSSNTQARPFVVVDSMGYAITSWEDFRNGNYDVYSTWYKDLGFYTRTNVPIIITGTKIKGTFPPNDSPIYKYSKQFISDVNGDINIGDGVSELEWDSYNFEAGGLYTIISLDQPEPLAINPGAVEEMIINVEP